MSSPQRVARPPAQPSAIRLSPGTHVAVATIPVGGATKKHPAVFVIKGTHGQKPVVIVTDKAPDPGRVPPAATAGSAAAPSSTGAGTAPGATTSAVGAGTARLAGPGGQQAGRRVKYDVVYSLITVRGGQPVDEAKTAYAFANCNACTTVAVSFQLVLVVGESQTIAPINFAGALNGNCPACVTTAIADQIVVTLKAQPSDDLLKKLNEELRQLNAIPQLGAGGSPAAVAGEVADVQHQIETELDNSGLLANPRTSTSTSGPTTPASTTPGTTTPTSTTPGSTTPTTTPTTTDTTPATTTPTSPTDTTTSTQPSSTTTTPTTTAPSSSTSSSGTSTTATP
ncbi:MAG: hypothetical protein ACXVFL_06275 [Solirubrobacteraceae bacterium]